MKFVQFFNLSTNNKLEKDLKDITIVIVIKC